MFDISTTKAQAINNSLETINRYERMIFLEKRRLALLERKIEIFTSKIASVFTAIETLGLSPKHLTFGLQYIDKDAAKTVETTQAEIDSLAVANLAVNLQLSIAESPKAFKAVPFAGYTKGGSGRNQDKLLNKANKVKTTFERLTGFNTSVNSYSCEENHTSSRPVVVLVSLTV